MLSALTAWEFLAGVGSGGILAALAYATLRWRFRVRQRGRRSAIPPDGASRSYPTKPVVPPPVSVAAASAEAPTVPLVEAPKVTAGPVLPVAVSTLRLSQRVLLHLLRNAAAGDSGDHVQSLTQQGIGTELEAAQGRLSSVLRRLEDGGAISSEKAHVRGRSKRVKVYRLTPRGRELALRHAQSPAIREPSPYPPGAAPPREVARVAAGAPAPPRPRLSSSPEPEPSVG